MGDVFGRAAALLQTAGLPADLHRGHVPGQRVPLPFRGAGRTLSGIPGLVWKANLVWYDVSKKLHLYGYQYSYIPSLIHQNVLVFRKE